MFSSFSIKFLFVSALLFASCGWRAAKTDDAAAANFVVEELKSGVPFSTKEPETFQAEFVIAANGTQNKIFVARAGSRRRFDYDAGEKNQLTVLETDANRKFLLLPNDKTYAENFGAGAEEAAENSPAGELFNQTPNAKFTRLGEENSLTKYAVRLDDSPNTEALVFVDERIGLPVRQEFYSLSGEQKILTYAVEMKNFKPQADENLFEIPKDFRKVSLEALRGARREIKVDGE